MNWQHALYVGAVVGTSGALVSFLRWVLPKIKVKPPLKSSPVKRDGSRGPWD